jgi:hypothetical protein
MSKRDEDRAERLAAALRENLRKRKSQARGDASGQDAEHHGDTQEHGNERDDRG